MTSRIKGRRGLAGHLAWDGGHFTEWVYGALIPGELRRGPQTASGEEVDRLSSVVVLTFSILTDQRMWDQGEGRVGTGTCRNGCPASSKLLSVVPLGHSR